MQNANIFSSISSRILTRNVKTKYQKYLYCIHKSDSLKTKLLSFTGYLSIAFLLLSFSDPYTIKRISDNDFRYEFYTTKKQVKAQNGRQYYWFKGGAIHHAQSGIAGELLHDKFVKMYHSNQLAEQGEFYNGLKTGLWKTWYPDGTLESEQYWSKGQRDGKWRSYDAAGKLVEKGVYRKDRKKRQWVYYQKKDTIAYKNGEVYVKKPKLSKEEKAALKLQKKETAKVTKEAARAKKKADIEALRAKKDAKKEAKRAAAANKEPGFFKRMVTKKTENQKAAPVKKAKGGSDIKKVPQAEKKPGFFKRIFSKKPAK
jgi:hypothetical protein